MNTCTLAIIFLLGNSPGEVVVSPSLNLNEQQCAEKAYSVEQHMVEKTGRRVQVSYGTRVNVGDFLTQYRCWPTEVESGTAAEHWACLSF